MHPLAVRYATHPYFQWRIGGRVGPRLAELERSQWLSPDELAARQWRKVRVLLDHAAGGVPFYRRLFRELGATPEDIRTPEDLQALPVLSKQIIRERQQELLAAGNFRLMRRTTSGSTGIPMVSFTDFGCRDWTLAAIRRERRWWGIDVGDRDARLTTARRSRRDWLRRYYLLNQAEFRCVELSAGAMTHLYQELARFRPAVLRAASSTTLAHFARFVLEQRPGQKRVRPRVIFCTGEVLYPHQRELIAQAFGCPVVSDYGTTENGLIAGECPAGRMHINVENHLLEFRPVPGGAGEVCEILLTDLNNWGMPFIRYAVGDLGVAVAERCPCGRGLPLMAVRGGRTSDLAVLPDGGLVDNAVFCEIFERIGVDRIRQYRIVQEAVDRFTVLVAATDEETVRTRIVGGFRAILGDGAQLTIEFVSDIPREASGKLRHFVSNVARPAAATPAGAARSS